MKKFSLVIALMVLVASVLTACGGVKDPKEALLDSVKKSQNMESYNFEGNVKVGVTVDSSTMDQDTGMVLQFLEDFNIKYSGSYQKDPAKMEIELEAKLNLGDIDTTIKIPIILDEKNIWIKVPSIPGLELGDIAGKYIHASLDELAELSGQELDSFLSTSQTDAEPAIKTIELLLNTLNEEYFTSEKKDGVTVVTFDFSDERVYNVIDSIVKDFIPQFAEMIEKNDYYSFFNLTKEDVAEMKKLNEEDNMKDYEEGIKEMKKAFTLNKGTAVSEINKDDFTTASKVTLDFNVKDEASDLNADVVVTADKNITNINKDVTFNLAEPKEDEIIPVQELAPLIYGMMMGGY